MQNIKDLRVSLMNNYSETHQGQMDKALCKELANTAGKILNSCKVELEYNQHMGYTKKIEFLEQA